MRGPGAELVLKPPQEVAVTLADGITAGHVLIPSDETAWKIIQRWAESPDAFIRDKIARFEQGETGRPTIPDALWETMR